MENLELQKKIINLGKLFVKELKLETSVDTLSRWMAHYIAEKITIAEKSDGVEKQDAEKECFNTILQLWQHRASLPHESQPFMNFEKILKTLNNLNPEKEQPFFHRSLRNQDTNTNIFENFDLNSIGDCMDMVKGIDKSARIWIEFLLRKAARNVADENVKEWLENSVHLSDSADSQIINNLLDSNPEFYDAENKDDFARNYEILILQKRIEELKAYSKLNTILLAHYEEDLKNIR